MVATKNGKPRARHLVGVNRLEQAQRVREIIGRLPQEGRNVESVGKVLKDHGILIGETSIKAHLRAVGTGTGGNGQGGLEARMDAVRKAAKVCGGLNGLKEMIEFIERARSL